MSKPKPKPNPKSAKRTLLTPWDEATLAAECLEDERDYLAWARCAIAVRRWHRRCPSRRCRRNGCADASRCEPQFHDALMMLRLTLSCALLEDDAISREIREGEDAAQRRALLAEARASGLLPL